MNKTLYELFELTPKATDDELRAAFDALSTRYAPSPGLAPELAELRAIRLQALREAWSVLGNPRQRDAYDASLHAKAVPVSQMVIEDGFVEPVPHNGYAKIWLALGVIAVLLFAWNTKRSMDLESEMRARAEEHERRMLEADAHMRNADVTNTQQTEEQERQLRREAERQEEQRRREHEAAMATADRAAQQRENEAMRQEREERREAERWRSEAQRKQYEADREAQAQADASRQQLERQKRYVEKLADENKRVMRLE